MEREEKERLGLQNGKGPLWHGKLKRKEQACCPGSKDRDGKEGATLINPDMELGATLIWRKEQPTSSGRSKPCPEESATRIRVWSGKSDQS
jgi:hypothetical protein